MRDDQLDDREWSNLIKEALDEERSVPPYVLEAGRAAYTWRTIDAELAQITFDFRTDAAAAAVRSSNQASLQALTFTSSSFTIELQLQSGELLGQLVPAPDSRSTLSITVMDEPEPVELVLDDLGCFTVLPIPSHPFRLQLSGPEPVATDWITL